MKRLTLTFDNGPRPDATDKILDTLARFGLKATFFLIGNRLDDPAARRCAERAKAEGHWIGNHTFSHRQPLGLYERDQDAIEEIELAERAIGDLAHANRWFRPPGKGQLGPHLLSKGVVDYLEAERFTTVTWNNVPRDWEDSDGAWIERALATAATQYWSVLVLHDHHMARMPGTLERFLEKVSRAGTNVVQEFPDDCTPMRSGVATPELLTFMNISR